MTVPSCNTQPSSRVMAQQGSAAAAMHVYSSSGMTKPAQAADTSSSTPSCAARKALSLAYPSYYPVSPLQITSPSNPSSSTSLAEPKLTRFANILGVFKPTWFILTESWAEGAHSRRAVGQSRRPPGFLLLCVWGGFNSDMQERGLKLLWR